MRTPLPRWSQEASKVNNPNNPNNLANPHMSTLITHVVTLITLCISIVFSFGHVEESLEAPALNYSNPEDSEDVHAYVNFLPTSPHWVLIDTINVGNTYIYSPDSPDNL